jgi:hypothetical protein
VACMRATFYKSGKRWFLIRHFELIAQLNEPNNKNSCQRRTEQ